MDKYNFLNYSSNITDNLHKKLCREKHNNDLYANNCTNKNNSKNTNDIKPSMKNLSFDHTNSQLSSLQKQKYNKIQHVIKISQNQRPNDDKEIIKQTQFNYERSNLDCSNMIIDDDLLKKNDQYINKKNNSIITNINPHYDFIIGRGKNDPSGYMNFPLNPIFSKRNIVFIDANPIMNADIKQLLHHVDFNNFGICHNQDPMEVIDVRFLFDWSSFYCGALQNLNEIISKIGRKCQIFVPLSKDENTIPIEIKGTLSNKIFMITLVEGYYPLFNWNNESQTIKDYINPNRYIRIYAYHDAY